MMKLDLLVLYLQMMSHLTNSKFKEMQAMILKMVNDTSVNHEQLLEMQGRLHRMEQGFMERSAAQKRQDDVDDDDDDAHNDSTTEDDE
ncbi:hypothetical protein Sjap_011170 [Stephania japonica]|uniref:Uncharacterized protein n=1 Tax=Stephania japonica TaxID=461633 RepID=A0AAP0JD02_9MAGN